LAEAASFLIRYYGLYSNVHRGKIRKAGISPSNPPIIEEEERFMPSKGWAENFSLCRRHAYLLVADGTERD